ncbi:hypothetical protein D3C72_1131350 [compost metagenome]
MRDIDTARLRRHLPATGNHIRTLAEQFGGQCRRQFQRSTEGQCRALQLRARPRTFAGERSDLVATQGDFFIQRIELTMGFRQWRFGLADFEMRADSAVQTFLRQIENLLLLLERRGDDVALRVMQRQFDVGADDVVLQFQLRQPRLGRAHVRQIHRAFTGIAFTAPEVEGITETQCGVVVPGGGVGQIAGAVELIGRPVVAFEGRLAIDLQ